EQVRGDPVSTATDVYSLGVMLYELLAGGRPLDVATQSRAEIERIVARDPRVSLPEGWRLDSRLRLPFLGAETLMEAGARVLEHLERRMAELREASEDTLKVFVGHGGGFRHAAIHMGLLTVEQMPALSMEYCQPVHLEYRGPGKWSHLAGDWKIRRRETPRD
ncbi:MAG: hypothetical protein KC729_08880, partial [Candidatus Eisenbacteria bacterium]|nr:hypothetical protein [Candidatus Eisenbacteria bacterium]